MLHKLMTLGILVAAPISGARAADSPAAPSSSGMWVYLQSSVPGAAEKCVDAQPAGAGTIKVPLFSDRSAGCPVATIDGGPSVTMDDLAAGLAGMHEGQSPGSRGGKQDPTVIVNRLVDAKLVVMEGEAMGIDELPELKEGLKAAEESIAREMLKEQVLRGVQPDPAEVKRLFEDKVREYRLQSILFPRESDAVEMGKQLKAGRKFDDLAAKAVADKKAKGNEPGQWVHVSKLLPAVLANVQKTKVGQATPPVKVPGGFTVVDVEAVRYPEDAKARSEAEAIALLEARKRALKKYYDALVKKYARVDEKMLKKLDFEAKTPGFEALKKDKRVIATVQGQSDVTIGLLATALGEQFFHGVDNATQARRLNNAKGTTLDALVSQRVVAAEVDSLGIEKSPEFQRRMENARESQVFGAFVKKVVLPNVKLDEAAVRKYYDTHQADYAIAAFYKLESIGFGTQKAAEAAVSKLRSGTDFKWLNANAEGKLGPGQDSERPNGVISSKAMTPTFAKVMEGARAGDFRVYAAPHDQFYVVHVLNVTPPSAQPFDEVREGIVQKLYGEAVQKSVEDWIGKLRKVHPVHVYLSKVGA
ncbi:MAG: peptidyl-prolyl cis-trans isomerase [Anaeromyxobacteraceae bacterium]